MRGSGVRGLEFSEDPHHARPDLVLARRAPHQLLEARHLLLREYYNHERCHSGLDGRRIDPRPEPPDGEIRMFSRLGGLLKCYRRVAPGTPGGVPVDAPQPPARASA